MDGGRSRHHLGAGLLLVGVLSAAGLAACTDDEPAPRPSITAPPSTGASSPTPSATATATAPVAPKAEPTPKSAEAFVKYFWDVYNYSYTARDSRNFNEISGPDCAFCNDTIRAINELLDDDHYIRGSDVRLGVAVAPPTDPADGLIVATVISEHPGRIVTASGSTVSRTKGVRNMKSEIALDWTARGWIVRDLANDEKTGEPW